MSSTDDIKPWLVKHFANKGQTTRAGDWKRRSKSKDDQGQVVRTFEHPTLGSFDVVSTGQGLALVGEDSTGVVASGGNSQNPLFERFPPQPYEDEDLEEDEKESLEDFMAWFSGRIVYAIEASEEPLWTGGMGVSLMCGFETSEGHLYDQHCDATYDMMRFLFPDRVADETIAIGESESAHSITCREGETIEQVCAMIRERMRHYRVVDMDDLDYVFSETDSAPLALATTSATPFVFKDAALESWKNQFKLAIKKDDLAAFELLVPGLQALATGPFNDTDARMRPLASAALEEGAVSITRRLIELGAPLSLLNTYDHTLADMGNEWEMVLRKKPEQALEAIAAIPASSGWVPEKTVRGYRDFLGQEFERDAWADLALMAASHASEPRAWLDRARAALGARTGEEKATESFLRAHWVGMNKVPTEVAQAWAGQMQEALDTDITFLDRYPRREGWSGQAVAGLAIGAKNPVDFMQAVEMSRKYGFDLANLKTNKGTTVLQALLEEGKKAQDVITDERKGAFIVVMTDHQGNQSTRGGDAAIKLKMIRNHLRILEEEGARRANPKPGSKM